MKYIKKENVAPNQHLHLEKQLLSLQSDSVYCISECHYIGEEKITFGESWQGYDTHMLQCISKHISRGFNETEDGTE